MAGKRRSRVVANTLLLLVALSGAAQTRGAQAEERPALAPHKTVVLSEFLGVNTLASSGSPEEYRRNLDRVKALGLSWVRLGLHWFLIEPHKDQLDLAKLDAIMAAHREAGIKTLAWMVGPAPELSRAPAGQRADQYPPRNDSDYAERLAFLAERYPQIAAWQVWNEPNLRAFWQPDDQPGEFHHLVEVVSQRLRRVPSHPTLVLGGMAYYSAMAKGGLMFENLAKLGTFSAVDAVAYHPYLATPLGDADAKKPYNFLTNGAWLNNALTQLGAKQIWATEWGWPSYRDRREHALQVSEEEQATFILDRLALLMALDFDKCFYFMLNDLPTTVGLPDRAYGLLHDDGSPKPAYTAIKNLLKITGDRISPVAAPHTDKDGELWSVAWKRADGRTLWFVWSERQIDVKLKGFSAAELHDPLTGERHSLTAANGAISVAVRERLQVVELP
jgi:beta-xylosidase